MAEPFTVMMSKESWTIVMNHLSEHQTDPALKEVLDEMKTQLAPLNIKPREVKSTSTIRTSSSYE